MQSSHLDTTPDDAAFDQWAANVLAIHSGLPERDLLVDSVPYLKSLPDKDQLAEALFNFVGSEPDALALIEQFVTRRFSLLNPPTPPTLSTSFWSTSLKEVLVPPVTLVNENKQSNLPNFPSISTIKPNNSTKKSSKSKPGMTLEEFEEMNRSGKLNKNRIPCNCHGQKHDLLTNCLTCGRIVCMAQGPGPCLTCSTLVLSSKQQLDLLTERLSSISNLPSTTFTSLLEEAQANQARLLDYDTTSAQRTVVIDSKADFVPYQGMGALWLSDSERNRVAKLDAERRAKLEMSRMSVPMNVDIDMIQGQIHESKSSASLLNNPDTTINNLDTSDIDHEMDESKTEWADETAYTWTIFENNQSIVKKAPSVIAKPSSDKTNLDSNPVGTGAYIHTGLDFRPLYVEVTEQNNTESTYESEENISIKIKTRGTKSKVPPIISSHSLNDQPNNEKRDNTKDTSRRPKLQSNKNRRSKDKVKVRTNSDE